MIFRRHFGIKKEFISVNGADGILQIGNSTTTISLSIIGVKNLIEFIQDVIFFFDADPVTEIQKVITRGEENIFLIAHQENGKRKIKLYQQKGNIDNTIDSRLTDIVFENSFEIIEFQDALCCMSLYIIAPTLFQYTNLIRFFKELVKEQESITKFDDWCVSDVSEPSNWIYLLIKKLLPQSENKQEELSLLIFMNIEFLQSYYTMFYTIHQQI